MLTHTTLASGVQHSDLTAPDNLHVTLIIERFGV